MLSLVGIQKTVSQVKLRELLQELRGRVRLYMSLQEMGGSEHQGIFVN